MSTNLKVEMVSTRIGDYRGNTCRLVCDARLAARAVDAAVSMAKMMNISPAALVGDEEFAKRTVLDSLMELMEAPALSLLSDFRDTYTAPRTRIIEMRIDNSDSRLTFGIIPTLKREDSTTVRISGIEVKVLSNE